MGQRQKWYIVCIYDVVFKCLLCSRWNSYKVLGKQQLTNIYNILHIYIILNFKLTYI